MDLSVCIIARDEETNISRAIGSVQGVAGQIVVVDTGSADRTAEIARAMGAEVYEHRWGGDFAAARNASLGYARGRWILVLDADEELDPRSLPALRAVVARKNTRPYGFRVISASTTDSGTEEAELLRLFQNRPELRYTGRIHEQVAPWIFRTPDDMPQSGIRLIHHGYNSREDVRKDRRERNRRLLELAIAETGDPTGYYTYQLGKEWALLGEFEKAVDLLESVLDRTDRITHPMSVRALAACYERLGRTEDELSLLDRWIPVYPDYTDLRYLRAVARARKGQLLQAAADLTLAVAQGDAPVRYERRVGTGSFLALETLAKIDRVLGLEDDAARLEDAAKARREEAPCGSRS